MAARSKRTETDLDCFYIFFLNKQIESKIKYKEIKKNIFWSV